MSRSLSPCHLQAIGRIAGQVDRILAIPTSLTTAEEAVQRLKGKRFDYNGEPVDHMMDLNAEQVGGRGGPKGPDHLKEALDRPDLYLLPETELPERRSGSRVSSKS